MSKLNRIASACYNDIVSGLSGTTATINIPMQQLEQEILETRLQIIHQYAKQNLLESKDVYDSLNCIELDCKSIDKCCSTDSDDELIAHAEIPQLAFVAGEDRVIQFVGSTDKQIKFKVYFSNLFKYHKYKIRGKRKPFVYIDPVPNSNNLLDMYVFNAPLLERLSITAIFKSFDQVEELQCCQYKDTDNFTDIDLETQNNVVKKYIQYYRQLIGQPYPNTQNPGGIMLGTAQS